MQRLESIKAHKCNQCGEWFYYQRTTAQYCTPSCRKQASRGVEPTDKYKHDLRTEYERIMAVIAESSPRAFQQIEQIKLQYGHNAMVRTIQVIQTLDLWR